jgi:catechol 2,3-dioxygenase
MTYTLPPQTHIGPVTLRVADLTRSVDFYTNIIGLKTLSQNGQTATMGAGTTPLFHLHELKNARPQPDYSTGLYHVAILTPSRPALGQVLINLARTGYPVQGGSDHLVSEALYLADPDGSGLEIYRDRPRSEWQWNGDQVTMANAPLDIDGIMASAGDTDAPFTGIDDGTTIGHIHLRVADIPKTETFYTDILGFDLVAQMPSALFMSAGRYHHHIGANVWHSPKAPPPPADSVGLLEYTVIVPDAATVDRLTARLTEDGIATTRQDTVLLVDDPSGNHLRIIVE